MIPQQLLTNAHRLKQLLSHAPKNWDGRSAIAQMKEAGSRHWRQTEWIGFYGEMIAGNLLDSICEIPGRTYDRVTFDIFSKINWDLKVHPNSQPSAILNDCVATRKSIDQYEFHGLIIFCVDCEYDDDGAFKAWHDDLKGKKSRYEEERERRKAPSRRRKTLAVLTDISLIVIDRSTVSYLGNAQRGWRNADGRPRREKYSISHSLIVSSDLRVA